MNLSSKIKKKQILTLQSMRLELKHKLHNFEYKTNIYWKIKSI